MIRNSFPFLCSSSCCHYCLKVKHIHNMKINMYVICSTLTVAGWLVGWQAGRQTTLPGLIINNCLSCVCKCLFVRRAKCLMTIHTAIHPSIYIHTYIHLYVYLRGVPVQVGTYDEGTSILLMIMMMWGPLQHTRMYICVAIWNGFNARKQVFVRNKIQRYQKIGFANFRNRLKKIFSVGLGGSKHSKNDRKSLLIRYCYREKDLNFIDGIHLTIIFSKWK